MRGVTFQPVQNAGRTDEYDPATDRLTLTEVRRNILEQTNVFRPEDVIPVPCHPDSLAMAYALKLGEKVVPLTGLIDPQILINAGRNTIIYEQEAAVHEGIVKAFATNHSPQSGATSLRDLLCCLPQVSVPAALGYENLFRVIIMQFIDAHAFDVRSVKKTCVHIVHPDGRLIPFDTFNMFYRDDLEADAAGATPRAGGAGDGHGVSRVRRGLVSASAAVAVMSAAAIARQTTPTAILNGAVIDQRCAALPRASVTVRQLAGELTRTVSTDRDGRFSVGNLPAGDYAADRHFAGIRRGRAGLRLASTPVTRSPPRSCSSLTRPTRSRRLVPHTCVPVQTSRGVMIVRGRSTTIQIQCG